MMKGIVKRNANAALVDTGDMGYWVITRINGKLHRLFAGGTIDKAMNVYNWYRRYYYGASTRKVCHCIR